MPRVRRGLASGESGRAASRGSTTRRRGAARLRSAGERAASLRGRGSEELAFAAAGGWVWLGGSGLGIRDRVSHVIYIRNIWAKFMGCNGLK